MKTIAKLWGKLGNYILIGIIVAMAVLQPHAAVHPAPRFGIWFGDSQAKAAGTADYSLGLNGTANAANLTTAINALPSQGGLFHFKVGTYNISSNSSGNITRVFGNMTIEGEGKGTLFTGNGTFVPGGSNWVFTSLAFNFLSSQLPQNATWNRVYTLDYPNGVSKDANGVYTVLNLTATNINMAGNITPTANNTYNVGSSTNWWANVWTNLVTAIQGVFTTLNATQVNGTTGNFGTLNAPTGRGATYVIAASDANATAKSQADVVLTGTADQVIINAALASYPHVYIIGGATSNVYITSYIATPDVNDFTFDSDHVWIHLYGNSVMLRKTTQGATNYRGEIKGFNFDGRSANNTGSYGLDLTGMEAVLIQDVHITDTDSHGIFANNTNSVKLTHVDTSVVKGAGYNINNAAGWILNDVLSEQSTLDGFDFTSDYEIMGNAVQADQDGGRGIVLSSSHRCHFTNTWVANNGAFKAGIWVLDSSDNSFMGGSFYPTTSGNNTIGVYFSVSNNTACVNNLISGFSLDGSQATGVVLVRQDVTGTGNLTNDRIEDCSFTLGAGGTKFNLNSGTQGISFKNNSGYVTENSGNVILAANTSIVTVTHGLVTTPTWIGLTSTSNLTQWLFVSGVNATSFNITSSINVTSNTTLYWRATVGAGN